MNWEESHARRGLTAEEIAEGKARKLGLEADTPEMNRRIQEPTETRSWLKLLSSVPPFGRIPTEILCQIAQCYVEEGGSPLKLSHVSSNMRAAVNGMKKLWTKIWLVNVCEGVQGLFVRSCKYLRLLLERADGLPLKLTVELPLHNTDLLHMVVLSPNPFESVDFVDSWALTKSEDLSSGQGILVEEIYYVHPELDILGNKFNLSNQEDIATEIRASLSLIHQTVRHSIFSCVTAASITIWNDSSPSGRKVTLPQLRRLALTGTSAPIVLSRLSLPNLESLSINGGETGSHLHVEQLPTTLHSLTLENISLRGNRNAQSHLLASLTKLGMFGVSTLRLKPGALSAPHLVELDWGTAQLMTPINYGSSFLILQCQLFGPTSLTQITLRYMELDISFTQDLETQIHLQTIRFVGCTLSKGFLDWLSNCGEVVSALPNLIQISLELCRCMHSDYCLIDFVSDCALNRPTLHVEID